MKNFMALASSRKRRLVPEKHNPLSIWRHLARRVNGTRPPSGRQGDEAMRFMVLVKADTNSEAGVMPDQTRDDHQRAARARRKNELVNRLILRVFVPSW